MLCLVCDKKVPLHRQLAGSPFCSKEHREQYGARQSKATRQDPLPAKFAHHLPVGAALEAQPDATAFRTPIPRFCDVILCRRYLKPRYTIGSPGAPVVGWMPDTAPPTPGHTLDAGPQEWNLLQLGLEAASPLSVPRRLSTAPAQQASQALPGPRERVRSVGEGAFWTMPWDASFRTRWPGAYGVPAKLVVALPFLPILTLSNMIYTGSSACAAPFPHELAKPGWRTQQTWLPPVRFAAPSLARFSGESPPPAPMIAGVLLARSNSALFGNIHLAPRELFQILETNIRLQTLSGIGESFTLADMEPALLGPEPIASRLDLALFQPREVGKPDTSDFEFVDFFGCAAPFATDEWPWPYSGVFRPLYDACDFSLQPVWLASLFQLGHPFAGPRLCGAYSPGPSESPARFGETAVYDGGRGFSGVLALPKSAGPIWDAGETGEPAPPRVEGLRDHPLPKNPWREALLVWQSIPRFARGLAVAIPLIAPAMFYAPTIDVPHLSSNQGALMASIESRAQIDLREDFQAGLGAWTGPAGWESTWVIENPGVAQPGRMALYRPRVPLTDYRLELQGQILSKALGFVFRAIDMNNYYAAKIAIRKPGPLPSVYLVRYAVIEGRAGQKTETLLPMYLRTDTLYDVLVTAQGDNFTITVNGQLVETWSDSRLKSGGVGLLGEKGEIAQVRSIHVTENVDFLGWICSQVSHWNADRTRIGVKHE